MSITSSIIAELSNKIKNRWVKELDEAIELNDMEKVKEITDKIRNYYFSE